MRPTTILIFAGIALTASTLAQAAEIVGSTTTTTTTNVLDVTTGWSAKRQVIGQAVFNDKNEKIGTIDDVVIGPDKSASYAVIGAGGFLGMGKHDVAIPVTQLKQVDNKFVLAGATKDALKAMPAFEYAN
jgi:sporulation protein YlmC with PRC-barrel domain